MKVEPVVGSKESVLMLPENDMKLPVLARTALALRISDWICIVFEAGINPTDDAKLIDVELELTILIGVIVAPSPFVIWKNIFAYALTTFGVRVAGNAILIPVDPLDGIVPVIGVVFALNTFNLNECVDPKSELVESLYRIIDAFNVPIFVALYAAADAVDTFCAGTQ